jgi:two-component system sensor kinase
MTAASTTLVVIMGLLLYWAHNRVATAIEAEKLADEIVGSEFERGILRSDYLRNDNDRAKEQWLTKHDHILALLKKASSVFEPAEDRETIGNMLKGIEISAVVFQQIANNRGLARSGRRASAQAFEIENRLVGQMLLRSYDIIADARKLQEASSALSEYNFRTISTFSLGFAGVLAVFVIITAWSLRRIITQGLAGLHEGAMTIGAGNLEHRIPLEGGNEFAEVAGTFNTMAEKLSASYADLEREITERKRASAEIERLNQDLNHTVSELQAANKELEAFSYSVSHDLRAPLRAIDSFSRIVMEDYDEKLDDEGRVALAFIRDNTRKMAELIDDLLAFSRLGRQEMRIAEIDMAKMARQVFNDLKQTAAERVIQFHVGALPPVPGDPVLMRQVFFNLLENAIKYTRPKDHTIIEVGGWDNGDERVYLVRDDGVGFDMKYAHKLFGVFQRLHGSDEFEGTGVGLAIVQRVMHRHGGRVWAEGEVGRGATFYFALPVGRNPSPTGTKIIKDQQPGR